MTAKSISWDTNFKKATYDLKNVDTLEIQYSGAGSLENLHGNLPAGQVKLSGSTLTIQVSGAVSDIQTFFLI